MTTDLRDLLPDYVLGALPAAEAERVKRDLARDPALAEEAARLAEDFALLALALPEEAPPLALRDRILDAAAALDVVPYAGFADRIGRLFDLAQDEVRALLRSLGDALRWEDAPFPGVSLFHLQPGPAHAGADAGFVRVAPGTRFPYHTHGGEERSIVLQGSYLDQADGRTYRAGDEVTLPAGAGHSFVVQPGAELLYAVVFRDVDFPELRGEG